MQNITSKTNIMMALYHERDPAFNQARALAISNIHGVSLHQAIWVQHGSVQLNDKRHHEGEGFELPVAAQLQQGESLETIILRFLCIIITAPVIPEKIKSILSSSETSASQLIASRYFSTNFSDAVLRLDRVDFPPTAIAWRHTHPGGGFRYLTCGSLTLHTDHEVQAMTPGDAWFEPADSPVKAVADTEQSSQFIRMMLLPAKFENRSSFTLCNQSDAHKPRLQTTHRFFDKQVDLNAL